MKARALVVVAACAACVSCALLSGASDLTTGDVPDGDSGSAADTSAAEDTSRGDTSTGADAKSVQDSGPTCDEPGLLARWTFDEGSGPTVHDCTSKHHDGTVDGGFWSVGERDAGMSFDGGWVGFGNPSDIQLESMISVCAWIRPEAVPAAGVARGYIVSKLSDPAVAGWRLAIARPAFMGGTTMVTMNIPDLDSGASEATGGSLGLAKWSHVCGVFSAAGSFVYVDGTKVGTDPTPSPTITPTTDEIRIGTRSDGMSPFVGEVDEVRIYSRALSDAEVKALAQP